VWRGLVWGVHAHTARHMLVESKFTRRVRGLEGIVPPPRLCLPCGGAWLLAYMPACPALPCPAVSVSGSCMCAAV
jgi:hypothetical protein